MNETTKTTELWNILLTDDALRKQYQEELRALFTARNRAESCLTWMRRVLGSPTRVYPREVCPEHGEVTKGFSIWESADGWRIHTCADYFVFEVCTDSTPQQAMDAWHGFRAQVDVGQN